MKDSLIIRPSGPLKGSLIVPGDKSISHRAIIFGAIAQGTTTVKGLLEAEDVLGTVKAMKSLGVKIEKREDGQWKIGGVGLHGLKSPSQIIDCGNSGTTLRLLTGLLSAAPVRVTLTGDASLNSRPMGRVIEPLRKMGAEIQEVLREVGRWIVIEGRSLQGGTFRIPVASAQLKSALLLAGLLSQQEVMVTEPIRSRDHTERMLKAFGASLRVHGRTVALKPVKSLKARRVVVPGDFSSAAFFLVAGLISRDPKTQVVISNVGLNPTRIGLFDVLKKMGGRIKVHRRRVVCGEPAADLMVLPSQLKGVRIMAELIPRLIDEVPILCVAAAVARGRTMIRGASELRIKETDRIKAIANEFSKFGVRVREFSDGLEIDGNGKIQGAKVMSHGDHRMAMSMAILGTVARGTTTIQDTACIATSFPSFVSDMKKIGIRAVTTQVEILLSP